MLTQNETSLRRQVLDKLCRRHIVIITSVYFVKRSDTPNIRGEIFTGQKE
jgi:hypothetical protein